MTSRWSKARRPVASGNIYTGIEGAELSNTRGWQREGRQGRQRESRQRRGAHRPEKGDVITGVNQQPIQNTGELRKILDSKPSVLALNIQRGESQLYLLAQ